VAIKHHKLQIHDSTLAMVRY